MEEIMMMLKNLNHAYENADGYECDVNHDIKTS